MRTDQLSLRASSCAGPDRRRAVALMAALSLAVMTPREASAQVLQRFALRVEVGAGTFLSDYQRNTDPQRYGGNYKGYNVAAIGVTARLAFTLYGPLALQASFMNGFFPSSTQDRTGRVMAFEGGLRFEPRLGRVGRLFVDGNVGYALTGPLARAEVNAGLGFEFDITPAVALGPVVRVADVIQPDATVANGTTYAYDAVYWTAGLSLALRVPEPTPQPPPPPDLLDTDCDRVVDLDDQCVTQHPGERPDPARRGCPLPDSDGDGVLDRDDQCVSTPAGDYPDDARRGCPDNDIDHDAVVNNNDQCPTVPAGATPLADRPGCPDPHPDAFVEGDQVRISRRVEFDTNRWSIDTVDAALADRNHHVLDSVVQVLRFHTAILRVEVQGHTDDRCMACPGGPRAYNLSLSERRAGAIRDYLVNRGIEPQRLEARGYGLSRPLEPNNSDEHRQTNRRVQFQILEANWPAPPPPPRAVEPHPLPALPALPPLPTQPCRVRPENRNGGAP